MVLNYCVSLFLKQVTSAHASQPPTTAQIHFLHDFVQKTVGLTLTGTGTCKKDVTNVHPIIDLSRFRSLRHLELRSCVLSQGSVPDQTLEGLASLRTQLEALVLVQVYHSEDLLWEVLAGGAVSFGPGLFLIANLPSFYCLISLKTLMSCCCFHVFRCSLDKDIPACY